MAVSDGPSHSAHHSSPAPFPAQTCLCLSFMPLVPGVQGICIGFEVPEVAASGANAIIPPPLPHTPPLFFNVSTSLLSLYASSLHASQGCEFSHHCAGSVGLELAAGADGAAVQGVSDGLHRVENWTPCPPLPGCITVNIGDPLQLWSDGLLKSNFHRVRMPHPDEPQVAPSPPQTSGSMGASNSASI